MLLAEQVVHCFYRVERRQWNFHEDGVPVAHRAVPQTRQLERLQLAAVLALATDEAGRLVHVVGQVEAVAFVVLYGAYKVYRVEVGSFGKHAHVLGVALVYLAAFEYLQAHRAVLIGYLMACVLYVANGMKWEKEIEPFIRWAVDYDLYTKMTLFGDAIRREQQQDACTYQPVNLYDSLNATFTYEEFLQARQKLNMGTDEKKANDLLRQWVSRQKIKRCDVVTSDSVQRFEKIA